MRAIDLFAGAGGFSLAARYVLPSARRPAIKMLGNAIVPAVGEAVIGRIQQC